jgi:Ras-related protein Rab-11A
MSETALKLVLLGDSNVGKSQLLLRYCKQKFTSDSQSTVGIEFATRSIQLNEFTIRCQVWDTAGQERFESMTKAYFRNAVAAILVYDIGNRQSFENMKNKWLSQLKEHAHEDIYMIIVGNKSDKTRRVVSQAEAADFAESTGLDFVETSACTGELVEAAFRRAILSVACLLPDVKNHMLSQRLPIGWLATTNTGVGDAAGVAGWLQGREATQAKQIEGKTNSNKVTNKVYLNIWTQEIESAIPTKPARTGMIVNGHLQGGVNFRDSGLM